MEIEDCELKFFKVLAVKPPNEMVMEVLTYCQLPSLLNCRLVCKNVNEMASYICRKRSVQLNTFKWNSDPVSACSIFRDSASIPWSSCTVVNVYKNRFVHPVRSSRTRSTTWHKKEPVYLSFFRVHGQCIKKFTTIGCTLRDIIAFLPCMPNLELLLIYATSVPPDSIFNKKTHLSIPADLKVFASNSHNWDESYNIDLCLRVLDNTCLPYIPHLPNLRKFYVDSIGIFTSPAFVEFISRQPRLEKVHLNYGIGITSHISLPSSVDALAYSSGSKLLSGIGNLDSSKPFVSHVLLNTGIRLKKFVININAFKAYDILEQILEANSETLEKLSLKSGELDSIAQRPPSNLRVPSLNALKFLKVRMDQNHPPDGFNHVTKFNTNQFQALTKIEFVNCDHQFQAFRNSVLDTVQELELNSCGKCVTNFIDIDWASIFPNLKQLKSNTDGSNLSYIFARMKQLEHLDLIVEIPPVDWFGRMTDASNINSIISGISNPSQVKHLSEIELKELMKTRTYPSILDLKGLNCLKVKFPELSSHPRNSVPFDDSGIIPSFVPLQRLKNLTLYNVQISNKCMAMLQARHEYVQVRQLHQPKSESRPKRGWLYNLFFGRN